MLLVAVAFYRWYTHGRDPIYVDDNSILMPAPPDGLTPAMATLLMDDRTSSRTVSAAMVDLAARGLMRFRQDDGVPRKKKTNSGSPARASRHLHARSRPVTAIANAGRPGRLRRRRRLPRSCSRPSASSRAISRPLAVEKGWLTGKPSRVIGDLDHGCRSGRRGGDPAHLLDAAASTRAADSWVHSAVDRWPSVATGVIAWFMPCRTQARGDAPGDAGCLQADAAIHDGPVGIDGRGRGAARPCRGSPRPTRRWPGALHSGSTPRSTES